MCCTAQHGYLRTQQPGREGAERVLEEQSRGSSHPYQPPAYVDAFRSARRAAFAPRLTGPPAGPTVWEAAFQRR